MDQIKIQNFCQIHKENTLDILYITQEDKQHELCYKCFQIDDKYQKSQIVYVNDILKAKEDTIITNLPPFEDQEIHPFLSKQFYSKVNQIETKIGEINTYYENLKSQFDNALKKVKVEADEKVSILQGFIKNLIDTYNQVSSKEQIQNIYQQNSENLSQQLHEFISLKFDQIKPNTEKMQKCIKQFNGIYDNFSFQQPNQIHNQIISLISKIDFFSNFQLEKYADLVKQQQEENNDDNQDNIKLNTEIYLDLICNKTNYCSQDFIDQLKQHFNKYSFLLNQTKINCQTNVQEKRDCFQNLNDEQLENIRVLSEKIQIIDQEYKSKKLPHFSDNIQPISYQIINDLKINFWNNTDLVEQTLKNYPIFELDDMKNKILSQKFNFIKSQCASSQKDQEISFVQGKIQILKINVNHTHAISYSNIKLDGKNKYIIRLHIQTNPNEKNPFLLFGLISDNNKDNQYLHTSGLTYNERNVNITFNKVIKGNAIASGSQNNINKQIEIRVHLEDKFIRVGSYPDYENVSELDDKNKINQNIQYRFATELYQLHDKLTINEIFVVDQFDNNM